jgi:hypothetical protein
MEPMPAIRASQCTRAESSSIVVDLVKIFGEKLTG